MASIFGNAIKSAVAAALAPIEDRLSALEARVAAGLLTAADRATIARAHELVAEIDALLAELPPTDPPPVDPPPVDPPPVDPPPVDPPPVDPPHTSGGLIHKSGLTYIGAFRAPSGFEWGGRGLGLGATGSTLYLSGHDHQLTSGEISIPEIRTSGYAQATLVQQLRDATDGRLAQIAPGYGGEYRIGGHFVYGGKLLVTGWAYYDADNQQRAAFFERSPTLSVGAGVNGPIALAGVKARYTAGYMAHVPAKWQSALGGPVLCGLPNPPIISNGSGGPTAIVFDPADWSKPAVPLLVYPHPSDLAILYGAQANGGQNPVWNWNSFPRGCAFVDDSVLFIGSHGTGQFYYGDAGSDSANPYKGNHSPPYRWQVWAYAAADLARVRAGTEQADKLRPYDYWTFDMPGDRNATDEKCGGVAYDAVTRRIYVSAYRSDGDLPLIHVFGV